MSDNGVGYRREYLTGDVGCAVLTDRDAEILFESPIKSFVGLILVVQCELISTLIVFLILKGNFGKASVADVLIERIAGNGFEEGRKG